MKAKLTVGLVVLVALVVLAGAGCGKKAAPPGGGPAMTSPPPGPAAQPGQEEAATQPPKSGEEQQKPEATKPQGETEGQTPEQKPGKVASEGEQSSDKPPKAKLTDDQFVELMGDLAVAIKKIADKKLPRDKAEAELENVAKKYGLTLAELEQEQKAHQVGSPQAQQALGMRVLKRMEERLKEEEKKTGKAKGENK